jgi:thiopeptide-type bacteriocin biosynthesis protein
MKEQYQFHPKLVLRAPQFPLSASSRLGNWEELLQDPLFMEALYLASPVLYAACKKMVEGEQPDARSYKKMQQAVVKYFTRMYSRCTPFGLFSGCAVASWKEEDTNIVIDHRTFRRHTRFDMHFLCALAQFIAGTPGTKEHLKFAVNSSLYAIGDEVRYIEYFYEEGKRIHKISAVQRSDYIDRVLAAAGYGRRVEELAALVAEEDISMEDAREFIDGLIEAQVLVSELEPSITGPEFIFQLLTILEKKPEKSHGPEDEWVIFLKDAAGRLKKLDEQRVNSPESYQTIQDDLASFPVGFDAAKLFQCDLFYPLEQNGVARRYQDQLLEALEVLHRISPVQETRMEEFIRLFKERYEDREMPLLPLLDTETGIPYRGNTGVELSPLLNDFIFIRPDTVETLQWGKMEQFWDAKIRQIIETDSIQVELTEKELEQFPGQLLRTAPSLSVLFRMLDSENDLLYLESAGGSSAANLLGRFAHGEPEIERIVQEVTEKEQELEPAVLYAEIVHLPENRMGNILLHPAFRKFEIPYLAKASVETASQIPASDLLVSVRNSRVVLRSRSLNREIIPRLSSAHNFRIQPLPVYEFLCDLQTQGVSNGYQFSWGGVAQVHKFLPRVQYKQVLLHAATWRLQTEDWKELLNLAEPDRTTRLDQWRRHWKLPEQIVIADGDNELLIDFSEPLLRSLFLDLLPKRRELLLKEFLFGPATGIRNNSSGTSHANQWIAVLQKQERTYSSEVPAPESEVTPVPDQFSVGSEWLYYKFYCGSRSAEKILVECLAPLAKYLEESGLIKGWFFIRYVDPHFHLRYRLQIRDVSQMGAIIQAVSDAISGWQQQGFIWKVQMDTYMRELKRYGSRSIEAVEELFHQNSIATVNWLSKVEGDEREVRRWIWGVKGIDVLLQSFGYDQDKKLELLQALRTGFAEEFHTGKLLKQQLDTRYRKYRTVLKESLESLLEEDFRIFEMRAAINELLKLQERNQLEPNLDELLASLIHMQLNRLFSTQPRHHEMICYDFLYRCYYEEKMRKKPVRT